MQTAARANSNDSGASPPQKPVRSVRNYWIRPKLQIRLFMHALIVLTFSGAIGVSFAVLRLAMERASSGLDPESASQLHALTFTLPALIVLFVAVIFGSTAVLIHRLAGPLVPMERVLERLAEGDFSARANLRKHDEFQELAERINAIASALENGTLPGGGARNSK